MQEQTSGGELGQAQHTPCVPPTRFASTVWPPPARCCISGGPTRSHRGVQCLAESVPQEGHRASAAGGNPCAAPRSLLHPRHLPRGHTKLPAPPVPRALSSWLCAPSRKTPSPLPTTALSPSQRLESQAPGSAGPVTPCPQPRSLAQFCSISLVARGHWRLVTWETG